MRLANPNDRALVERLRSSGALQKIEDKYRVALTPEGLIDCGKDACGWLYGDYVFKLTHSAADAQACLALLRLRRAGLPDEIKNGLAKIFEVCDLKIGIRIIISEYLPKPTPEEVSALREFSGSQRDLAMKSDAEIISLLDEKTLPRAKANLATRYGEGRIPDETLRRAYAAWRSIALLVRDYHVALYKDAHAGNFGRDAAGHLKLFDFGDSNFPGRPEAPADCNWGCDPVAQNPAKPRRASVYSAGSMLDEIKAGEANMDALLKKSGPKDSWAWGLWPKDRPKPEVGAVVWFHDPRDKMKIVRRTPVLIWKIVYENGVYQYWFRRFKPRRVGRSFGWLRELEPMSGIEERSMKLNAWPIDVPLPKVGDAVFRRLGGHGGKEAVVIWNIVPSPAGPMKGEPMYQYRYPGSEEPKGDLGIPDFAWIDDLEPMSRDERSALKDVSDMKKQRRRIAAKAGGWPVRYQRPPEAGDLVWFAAKGGAPRIGVEILTVVPFGAGGLPQLFEWRDIADAGEGGGQAFLNELWPPTKSELENFRKMKAKVDALKAALAPPAFKHGAKHGERTQKWFGKMDAKAAFHGGPSHADWIKVLAERGWIHKVEKFAKIKVGAMYACGAFGCAFAIKSPPDMARRFILKITSDQSEGPAQAYIGESQRKKKFVVKVAPAGDPKGAKLPMPVGEWFREGYTIIETIMTMGDTIRFGLGGQRAFGVMDRNVYAIIREDIDPDWEKSPKYARRQSEIDELLSRHRSYAQQYNGAKEQGRGAAAIAFAKKNMMIYMKGLESIVPSVAKGLMAYYLATGKAMQDVHGGNVGIRKLAEFGTPGDMVIFDPGMTSSKKADAAAKKHIKVVNNPGVMV